MATEEYLHRFLEQGKHYDDLPARFRQALPEEEWRRKVKTFCIVRGFSWVASVARTVCAESEYYEDLVAYCRSHRRLFPYHLSEYVTRVLRLTPFTYYIGVLSDIMREDLPYDSLPNFTAADAVRVVGVGRNEYIAAMVAAKSKRLLWRMNRGAVRDALPRVPRDPVPESWWLLHVVNVSEGEHRRMSAEELALARAAAQGLGGRLRISDLPPGSGALVSELYRRGLVWFELPVAGADQISVPPLEGFVSNRTGGGRDQDPLETLLYSVFVAASERVTVERLAAILGVDLPTLRVAISVACRLGFCKKLVDTTAGADAGASLASPRDGPSPRESLSEPFVLGGASRAVTTTEGAEHGWVGTGNGSGGLHPSPLMAAAMSHAAGGSANSSGADLAAWSTANAGSVQGDNSQGGGASSSTSAHGSIPPSASIHNSSAFGMPPMPRTAAASAASAVGIVVDSEVTGYLMMGALTPACKRHSVTLFEGGRVSGAASVAELERELGASAALGADFEGEMRNLAGYARALAALMAAARVAAGAEKTLELIRKESIGALDPGAAQRILAASYAAMLPVAGLPFPPLPVTLRGPGPVTYGPTPAACTPWLQVLVAKELAPTPAALVLPAGCQLRRLPPALARSAGALLWPWERDPGAHAPPPLVAPRGGLLAALNEATSHAALLVQPITWVQEIPSDVITLQQLSQVMEIVEAALPGDQLAPAAAGNAIDPNAELGSTAELSLAMPAGTRTASGSQVTDSADGWADFDATELLGEETTAVRLGQGAGAQEETSSPVWARAPSVPSSWASVGAGERSSTSADGVAAVAVSPGDGVGGASGNTAAPRQGTSSTAGNPEVDEEEPDAVQARLGSLRLVPSLTGGRVPQAAGTLPRDSGGAGTADNQTVTGQGGGSYETRTLGSTFKEDLLHGFVLRGPDKAVETRDIPVDGDFVAALHRLGLAGQLGSLCFVKTPETGWLLLSVRLGVPLQPPELCEAVCDRALAARFLDEPALHRQRERTVALQERLEEFGVSSNGGGASQGVDRLPFVEWPRTATWVRSGRLMPAADLAPCIQGLPFCL